MPTAKRNAFSAGSKERIIMLKIVIWLMGFVILLGSTGCSSPDNVYHGLYDGLQKGERVERSREDPSAEPISEPEPGYYQYKAERDAVLKKKE